MSSLYWLVPGALGIWFVVGLMKNRAKDLFVVTMFLKPDVTKHVPYFFSRASRLLIDDPRAYIDRHPVRVIRTLETIAAGSDRKLRDRAMQAIVHNIDSVAAEDESAAASALLTVINNSEANSAAHCRALLMRPAIIDSLAQSDPVNAVVLAQKGVMSGDTSDALYTQSCGLVLRHLEQAFAVEPLIAAHAACNIARRTHDETRETVLWMLLSHMNMVSDTDFESGHAAAEQAVLLGNIGTPLHQAAMSMWEWHIRHIQRTSPTELIGKMFYGFGISTAQNPNKADLYEHGFDFLMQNPGIIEDRPAETVKIALCIGLRADQTTRLYQQTVQVWLLALQELCKQNLRLAIKSANDAMTFTAPGSQFERQAQAAYAHLRQLDHDVTEHAHAGL